jgi:PAS domain S-box-containing protein
MKRHSPLNHARGIPLRGLPQKRRNNLNSSGFMPHGYCFLWRPGLLWLHVLSDLGIGLAYYGIPVAIFYFVRKREVPFPGVFWLFGAFILLCGTTHLLAIWVLWHANYYIEGYVKAATAFVSITTLITVIIVLPRALGLRGPAEMEAAADVLRFQLSGSNAKREQAEQRDERSRVVLSAVIDHVIDGVITINEQGGILSFNAACGAIFGYAAHEVMGRNLKMLMPEPYHGEHDSYLSNYISTGNAKIIGTTGRQVEARRKDGTIFPIDLSVSAFTVNGVRYFSGIVRDISVQRQAKEISERLVVQLSAKNTELERFAYVASHDMQEPLRMVSNFAEVLTLGYSDVLDDAGKEYLEIMGDAARRMRDMVRDLLEYARLGHEPLKFREVDTAAELKHVRENLMTLIADTKAVITADALPVIHGDGVEVMRLLQNLISNALKFQPPGQSPAIHISASREDTVWIFSVRDNGIGIEPAFAREIFEPYRRLHSWHEIKGTGLGLAFCWKIVENHSGRIWVESAPGAGSTFFFTLPASRQSQPPPIAA